ncbi:MAG: metallophosphoesterase family protein [Chitinivibrionales bacterium]|nr:metallophosphoesterase family protein [Chitinivibrionales bacterium]
MKIGIVSDTHRNKEFLEKAVDWLMRKQRIASLYHLGDDYDDVAGLADRYIDIVQVPGVYDERYLNNSLAHKTVETVLGLNIILVHWLEKDLTDDDIAVADVVLSGHTHRHEIKLKDGVVYLNPGHLKGPLDKNMPPSFGMIDITDTGLEAFIFDLNGKILQQVVTVRSDSGLYRG